MTRDFLIYLRMTWSYTLEIGDAWKNNNLECFLSGTITCDLNVGFVGQLVHGQKIMVKIIVLWKNYGITAAKFQLSPMCCEPLI